MGTEIPERKILPPYGFTCRLKYFSMFSEQESLDIFKTLWFLGDTNAHIILSLNATSNKTRKSLKLFQNVLLKKKILILFAFRKESMMICSP